MPRALGKFFATIALPLETDGQIHGHHGIRRPATLATSLLQNMTDFDGLYPHKDKHTWSLGMAF